jgi:hypothetical protein
LEARWRNNLARWFTILSIGGATSAWAATIPGLYDTGVGDDRVPLADAANDPHFRLIAGTTVVGPASVATSSGGYPIAPFGPWLGDDNSSAWITPSGRFGTHAPDGVANYRYETSFDLTGLDPATAVIAGHWATDNAGIDILINGLSTGQANPQQFSDFTYFQINTGFLAGRNTLTFLLNNGPGDPTAISPTGLRVEMAGMAEPITTPVQLSISQIDEHHAQLSWPVSSTPLLLRKAATPVPTKGWAQVTNVPVQAGDAMTVTVDLNEDSQFFRLQPPLHPRVIFPKPGATIVDTNKANASQVVLKFHEGSHVRLRSGALTFDPHNLSEEELERLQRVDLAPEQIRADLKSINSLRLQDTNRVVLRMFEQSEEELARNKTEGEAMSREELADLDLYYYFFLGESGPAVATDLINALNQLRSVEIAYPQPIMAGASCSDLPPTTTIDVTPSQGYLMAAPAGIDAQYAWSYGGGTGSGVRVIDVEGGWHLDHEDLPGRQFFQYGIFVLAFEALEHGTSVLGELVACDNGYGATGIVPDAGYGVSSVVNIGFYNLPGAVNTAAAALGAGDVILIEQHAPGPSSGLMCDSVNCGNCGQFEWVAMENWQADFDAIHTATARGIVVVEAAGNGAMNLDGPQYGMRFSRTVRDSGAILVGAGMAGTRIPWCWSNCGSRVDLQGWGNSVGTLGWGLAPDDSVDPSLRANGADPLQWYTRSFSGTSSASPIVAGAVCAIQGVRRAQGFPVLGPSAVRALLQNTGTPQPISTQARQIGPQPDLRNALNTFLPRTAAFVSQTVTNCMVEGWIYFANVTMRNSGRNVWKKSDLYRLGSQNPQDNFTWGLNRVELPGDVQPGGLVTFSFPVTAPSRGHYNFQWRMLQENFGSFGDFTPNLPIEVVPDNNAQFVSQNVPTTMVVGQTYPVSIKMSNVGGSTWLPNATYKLSSENAHGNSLWGLNAVVLNSSVPPNTDGTFQFNVVAPTQPGTYNFQWRMLQEGISCSGPSFGDFTPNLAITVTPPLSNDACFVSQVLPNVSHHGDMSTASVTMRNCGTSTWTSAANYRLGSQSPPNNLYWGLNRVDLPYSVPPGGTVTFTFTVTATQSAATFYSWQMVQDGVGFFGAQTFPILFLLGP